MTTARSRARARGEFPRLNVSADTRAAFNDLLGEAPKLGLDPERVEAAGLPGLRALLSLKQAAESGTARKRDAHLGQLQSTLRLLQYRKHPELVQQLQARAMALQGRGGDTEVAHVTVGEIVLPKALQTRAVIEALGRAAAEAGIPLSHLRVGSGRNSINPQTGLPEFAGSSQEPMEEIVVTAPRETGVDNSAFAVDEYGRSPEDISNPDFQRGQGEAVINALPGMGIARAMGYGPRWREADGFIPTGGIEKGPNLIDKVQAGRYGEAALTGIGAIGDLALMGGALRGGTQGAARGMIADLSAKKPSDFLYSPNGTVNWGRINPGAVAVGAAKDLPIRVMRGSEKDFGLEHVATPERLKRIKEMGFSGAEDYLDFVTRNHNLVLEQPGHDAIALVVAPGQGFVRNRPVNNLMAVTLHRDGDHYGLTSLIPNAPDRYLKSAGKTPLWSQGAYPGSQPR